MPSPYDRSQPIRSFDPHEVRAEPRVGIDLPAELVSSELPGSLPGRTRDLSVTGACIATPSPFAFKSLVRISIQLPEGPVQFGAEGRWQEELPGDGVVLTGVTFRELEPEVAERLWDLVLSRARQLTRFLYAGSDLSGLGLEEAMGLAQITRVRDVTTGSAIYRAGAADARADSIFILVRGRVVLQLRVRDAREVPFETLAPGALFGGLTLTADAAHAESAVADSDARLLEIDHKAYRHLLAARPWLALRLAQTVTRVHGRRLAELLARMRDRV